MLVQYAPVEVRASAVRVCANRTCAHMPPSPLPLFPSPTTIVVLLSVHSPQVVYQPEAMSETTVRFLKNDCRGAVWVPVQSAWSATTTLAQLKQHRYFEPTEGDSDGEGDAPATRPPAGAAAYFPRTILQACRLQPDNQLVPRASHKLELTALGLVVAHLRKCLIEHEILSFKNFDSYTPPDVSDAQQRLRATASGEGTRSEAEGTGAGAGAGAGGAGAGAGAGANADVSVSVTVSGDVEMTPEEEVTALEALKGQLHDAAPKPPKRHMVLDGSTLLNLEILENNYDGSKKGTLLGALPTAATPMGNRLLRAWMCNPLFDVADINARYVVACLESAFFCFVFSCSSPWRVCVCVAVCECCGVRAWHHAMM